MDLAQLERHSGIPIEMGQQIEAERIIEARCEMTWLDLAAGKFKSYFSLFGVAEDPACGEKITLTKHREFNFLVLRTTSRDVGILGEDPFMFVVQITLVVEGKKIIWKKEKFAPWRDVK